MSSEASNYKPARWLLRRSYRLLTSPLRAMPDFIIIGAQKGGTTSLYSYLMEHPSVIPSLRKEPRYFDEHFETRSRLWYQHHFPINIDKAIKRRRNGSSIYSGEASASYIFFPFTAHRIAETLPDVKLIALLRNPVERAFSNYQMEVRRGREPLSFEDALVREETEVRGNGDNFDYHHLTYSYLGKGRYADQLSVWMSAFPSERLLVVRSEDFFSDPMAVFTRVLVFLGLPEWRPASFAKWKEGDYAPMNPETRKRLVEYFEPHNQRLYRLLGMDFGWR